MSYQEQGGGSESVVVNGTVEGVEIKPNGRYVVKVRELGSTGQYALNLNTKEQALAQQMMNAIGQQFSFICGLSHWTNQSGQPVTSKWINGVAPLQQGMQPQAQPQQQGWSGAQQPQPQVPMQQANQALAAQSAMQQAYMPPQPQPSAAYNAPQPTAALTHPVGQQQEVTDDAFIRRVSFLAAIGPAVDALVFLPEEQRTVPALVKMADFFAQTAINRGQHGFGQNHNPGAGNPSGDFVGAAYGDPGPQEGYTHPADDDIPF